jgi:Mg2+ and Co2+ transporter CorA
MTKVSNHYDQLLAEEAVRDNSTVLIIAILGLVLLPMTFAAVRFWTSKTNSKR